METEHVPTVTVVTAAYNAASWLAETIESVQAQSFRDFEHIIVDDGSTDDTPEVVRRYGDAVRYIRTPNGGASAARNTGIRAARGTYIAFLDHDDLWTPDKLECQLTLHNSDSLIAWSYTDAAFFDPATGHTLHLASDKARPHQGDVLEALLFGNFIPFSSSLVHRSLFAKYGLLDERPERRHIDDWDFWLRLAAEHSVGYVDRPLLRYRWHTVQATQRMPLDVALHNRLVLIGEAVARHPERLLPLQKRACAAAQVSIGRLYLSRAEHRAARRMFAQALHLDPANHVAWTFLLASNVPTGLRRMLRSFLPRI